MSHRMFREGSGSRCHVRIVHAIVTHASRISVCLGLGFVEGFGPLRQQTGQGQRVSALFTQGDALSALPQLACFLFLHLDGYVAVAPDSAHHMLGLFVSSSKT